MEILTRVRSRVTTAVKRFTMQFATRMYWWGSSLGRTRFNYEAEVPDGGRGNAIVVACIGWVQKAFPEAPLRVSQVARDGARKPVADHPMVMLIRRPNDFYSGIILWMATLADWWVTGNAYWIKVRSEGERVVRLWYVPSWLIEPHWPESDSTVFIDYYTYSPGNIKPIEIPPSEVVHFRNGIDPNNVRKGLSPLASTVREIFTDDEGANYTATMLRNSGVPNVVVQPDGDNTFSPENAQQFKGEFMSRFGGDRRGEPMVLRAKAKIEQLAFNPEQMNVKGLRRIPEERVTAVLGVPAIVAGLGVGLDASTYNNLAGLREQAYEGNIIPSQRIMAEELHAQLLGDFVADVDQWAVDFDLSQVRVLQEDQQRVAERAVKLAGGPVLKLNEARQMMGAPELPDGDMFWAPVSATPINADDLLVDVTPVTPTPAATPPGGKAFDFLDLEEKASGATIVRAIERLRDRQLATETPRLARFLRDQRDLAVSIVRDEAKALIGFEEKAGDAERFANRVTARLEQRFQQGAQREVVRVHLQALTGVTDIVAGALDTPITVDDALRGHFLREAATNVRGITDVTMRQIRETLREGAARDETVEQLAARIQGLGAFGEGRAELISRNEIAIASNRASVMSYELSGRVESVQVIDGTQNDEACASMNGRIFSMQEAAGVAPIEHVGCVRNFLPLLRSQRALTNGHVHKELVGV